MNDFLQDPHREREIKKAIQAHREVLARPRRLRDDVAWAEHNAQELTLVPHNSGNPQQSHAHAPARPAHPRPSWLGRQWASLTLSWQMFKRDL